MPARNLASHGKSTRPRVGLVILLVLALLLVAGGWMGYNYFKHRTLWGNPNTYPPFVTSFGAVNTKTFHSKALGESMTYDVYLPPGYNDPKNASVRYPVVYLLHGAPGGYDDWITVGGANVEMDTLLAQKRLRPMILVMPQGSPWRFASSTEYVDGPLGKWETYISRDLVGEVDASYRTLAARDGRAIAGLSAGGYAAANIGLRHPDEYGVVGSFSGYFTAQAHQPAFGGSRALAASNSPASYLPKLNKKNVPDIYFYVGASDPPYTAENQRFAAQLKSQGIPYDFHVYPGGHTWSLWRDQLPNFLLYASKNLKGG